MHCHLREPGNSESETIKTGTLSAIAGGFTKVCCMPNTNPSLDNPKLINYVLKQSERAGNAEVFVIGCATKGRVGKEIANIDKMILAGIVAVSDDGSPISDSLLMQKVMEKCSVFNIPIINHCEILELSKSGVMNQGKINTKLGLKGIPDIAESIMVLRDIALADYIKGRVHIAHVSTKKSVDLIRWAKKRGIRVTAETCPHYFTLTENDCLKIDTNYKVSPPLRTKLDIEAIKQGLADGTIDAIATDHAPWHISKKNPQKPQDSTRLTQDKENKSVKICENLWLKNISNWEKAKSGMIGFETAFSLGYEELVLKKYLTLEKYIACLTTKPAKILNLKDTGKITEGIPAAITIFNLNKTWIPSPNNILSKSKNSPFIGRKLKGKVETVILRDKIFYL
jgi:dihydroorotase